MSCSDILFLISIGFLIGSIILCVKKYKELPKESDSISPIYFLMGGVFCSAFLLCMALEVLMPYIPKNPVIYAGMEKDTVLYGFFVNINPFIFLLFG